MKISRKALEFRRKLTDYEINFMKSQSCSAYPQSNRPTIRTLGLHIFVPLSHKLKQLTQRVWNLGKRRIKLFYKFAMQ